MKLKRQRLVSDGAFARMMQTAGDLSRRCNFQGCAEIMERAARLDPANSSLCLDLGWVYGKSYRYDAASACFEKAIRLAPDKTEALKTAGMRCLNFNRHDMAERYFLRATEEKNASPESLIQLAEICELRHRFDEAARFIDRALSANPDNGFALVARARLERQRGNSAAAEQILRAIPEGVDKETSVKKFYELGGMLDKQGRYDEAMSAYLEAKALMKTGAAPHATELRIIRERLRLLKNGLTAELLQRWSDFGKELKPHYRLALLAGNPRSGTTLLEQVLDSHPELVSAEETEIFHNSAYMPLLRRLPDDAPIISALDSAGKDVLQKSRFDYFRDVELLHGEPVGNRLLVDKNPSLSFLIPAFARIFPEFKLIVALRDPRDVCLSCFMQSLTAGQVSAAYLTLEDTIEEYAALMSTWLTIKPIMTSSYIEVKYEDMVENLESVARRTLDFLGVPWDPTVLRFDEHARAKLVRSPTSADVAKPVYKTARGRWRNYEKYLQPHIERLLPFIKAFGYEE